MKTGNKINEIVYREELPEICTETRKAAAGSIIESKYVKVKGHSLKECKKIHDQLTAKGRK